jgi:lysozyme family protein
MALFEPAFIVLMGHEDSTMSGVISPEPNGGQARFGINSVAWPSAVADGFYTMDHDTALTYAANFFKANFWTPIEGYQITDQNVANKFFDLSVNEGIQQATKITQRAVNSLFMTGVDALIIDGKPGQMTLSAINKADPVELLAAIKEKAKDFYIGLVASNPKFKPDLAGWLARAES